MSVVVTTNINTWKAILDEFLEIVPGIAHYPKTGPQRTASLADYIKWVGEKDLMRAQYKEFISTNGALILDQAVLRVNRYVNLYNVAPTDGVLDELKSIYFLGMTIAELLEEVGLEDLARVQVKAVVCLLDIRLYEPYRAARPQLTARVTKAVDDGNLRQHFGEFGLYITYKCLYNAAEERGKQEAA